MQKSKEGTSFTIHTHTTHNMVMVIMIILLKRLSLPCRHRKPECWRGRTALMSCHECGGEWSGHQRWKISPAQSIRRQYFYLVMAYFFLGFCCRHWDNKIPKTRCGGITPAPGVCAGFRGGARGIAMSASLLATK